MIIRKYIIWFVFLGLSPLSLFAGDFAFSAGAIVDNQFTYLYEGKKANTTKHVTSDITNLYVWMNLGIGEPFSFYMKIKGVMGYSNYKDKLRYTSLAAYKLSQIKLRGFFVKDLWFWGYLDSIYMIGKIDNFYYQLGRYQISDISSIIINNAKLDGILIGYDQKNFFMSLYSGYNGLLDKRQSLMNLSVGDYSNLEGYKQYFASGRLVSKTNMGVRFYNQTMVMEYINQSDFNGYIAKGGVVPNYYSKKQINLNAVNPVNSNHYSFKMEGLLSYLFYRVGVSVAQMTFVVEHKEKTLYQQSLGILAYMELNILMPDIGSVINMSAFYVTGDGYDVTTDAGLYDVKLKKRANLLNHFLTLSTPAIGQIFSPLDLTNISRVRLEYLLKPLEFFDFQVSFYSNVYFRSTTGPIAVSSVINKNKESFYLGLEAGMGFKIKPIVNLLMDFKLAALIMPEGAKEKIVAYSGGPMQIFAEFYIAFSF